MDILGVDVGGSGIKEAGIVGAALFGRRGLGTHLSD